MFEIMLFVHILAVAAWFGANLARAFVGSSMSKAGGVTAANWYRASVAMGRVLHTPAAIAVFVTGFGLVGLSDGEYEITSPFVVVGIGAVVVGALLAMRFMGPMGRQIAGAFDRGDDEAVAGLVRRSSLLGWLDTAILTLTTLLMVLRWGA